MLLDAVLAGREVAAAAGELDCDAAALAFFARAVVQRVAEASVSRPAGRRD